MGVGVSKIPTCHCSVSGSESWLSRPPPPAASWRPAGPSAPGGSYGRWKPSDFQLQTKKKKKKTSTGVKRTAYTQSEDMLLYAFLSDEPLGCEDRLHKTR